MFEKRSPWKISWSYKSFWSWRMEKSLKTWIRRPPIWIEEAAGFHKRVKRIHDPVKIVVPCAVFEGESPIPPDRSMQFSSYIGVFDDHQH
ncbi:hypothetical protein HID58_042789, partial [Brassica napus]